MIEKGLKWDLIDIASNIIDGYPEIFIIKEITIQEMLKKVLQADSAIQAKLPVRFLLGLEREIFTFFSLVKGTTSCAVIRIAMREYGNPHSEIYHLPKSQSYLTTLYQHFRVIIRGFGRIGDRSDLPVLQAILKQEPDFLAIDPKYQPVIKKIMMLVKESIDRISLRG